VNRKNDLFARAFLGQLEKMSEIRSGWLTKEGGSYKSWKKRWMAIEKGELVYYKKEVCDLSFSILCHTLVHNAE
jgi:hypothetical protein